jgi:O-antigen/teichoic acid export membrane protein
VVVHHLGKKIYDLKTVMGSIFVILCFFAIVALLFFFLTLPLLGNILYKGIDLRYLLFAMSALPFYFMLYYFSSVLQGCMLIKQYNVANQFPNYLSLLLILACLVFWKLNTFNVIFASVIGVGFGGAYALIKSIKEAKGLSFNMTFFKGLIRDGGKLYISSLATFIAGQTNIFIINYYMAATAVGYYVVASTIANTLSFLYISVGVGLYSKVSHANIDDAIDLIEVASRQVLLLTAAAAFFIGLLSKYIVALYGGRAFLPAVTPLIILLPGMVISALTGILANLWLRKGWFMICSALALFSAITSLALNFFLIPRYGANGASMAMTLSAAFLLVVEIIIYVKYIKRDLVRLFIPTRKDILLYNDIIAIFKKQ